MPEVELPPEFQEALDATPEVDETPSSDETTPEETPPEETVEAPEESPPETPSEEVAADDPSEEPAPEETAPDEPKAKKTTEWNSLQKEAKGLGINIRGMKKDDVQRLVEEGSSRLEKARDTARRLYRTSDEWLEGKSADDIDAALVEADKEYAARQQQARQQPQPQQPAPPQQQPVPEVPPVAEVPPEDDILSQLEEYYDPADPLVQIVNGINQKNQELLQQQQEMMSRYEAMESHLAKQHNDEMTRKFTSDFVGSLNSVGMPEIFGTDTEMTHAQQVQTQHVYNTVTDMLENDNRPGWTVADYVNAVVRAGYGPEINAIKQRQMQSIARDQSSTRLGSTGNVSRQEHVPNDSGHITENQELHALFNEMQKDNGSR